MSGISKNPIKCILSLFLTALFFISSCICSLPIYADTLEISIPVFQKGVCYATWNKEQFTSRYSDQALEMLKGMGVEFVQINVTLYQETVNSTKIFPTDSTPSDRSVKYVIRSAHKLGLKVMLKPHIDLITSEDGSWRADIGFYDEKSWNEWFKEYTKVILKYAKMAKKEEVEIFCVGTELSFTEQKTELWKKVISDVREEYEGKLVYASNWDNYKNVKFWEDLDFIGIDAYFPLTYKEKPSVDDIKEGWEKWIYEIEEWHAGIQKPIIFTEIGYASSQYAPCEPWKNGSGEADVDMQAKCYKAFFDAVWDMPWLAGVYWWGWMPTIFGGGQYNRQFTPLKKPAAKIMEMNYKARSGDACQIEALGKLEVVGESGKMVPVLPGKAGAIPPNINLPGMISASTLQPALKTQEDPEFKESWKKKQAVEYVN